MKLVDISTIWPQIPEHGDITDYIEAGGDMVKVDGYAAYSADWEPEEAREERPRLTVISAPDLQKSDLPDPVYLVEDILPEGTGMLSAASKIGKSWLVLDMGLKIAAGEPFMGHNTSKCGVLYLALEDTLKRLQDRMNKILKGAPAPPLFFFATEAPTLDNGLLDMLDDHIDQHPETKLIIIDTLQKVRGNPCHAKHHTRRTTGKWASSSSIWISAV